MKSILFPLIVICALLLTTCVNSTPTYISKVLLITDTAIIPSATATQEPEPTLFVPLSGCVGNRNLRIRKGPGTQYDILGSLPAGICVSIEGQNQEGGWAWITSDGVAGWVSIAYLSINDDINKLPIIPDDNSQYIPLSFTNTPTNNQTFLPSLTIIPQKTNTPQSPPTESILLCKDTVNNIGSKVSCTIQMAYCSYKPNIKGDPTFCNDVPYPNYSFTLLVWGSDWSDYNGKCIVVTGLVTLYKGKPQIEATSRSQVSFCS